MLLATFLFCCSEFIRISLLVVVYILIKLLEIKGLNHKKCQAKYIIYSVQ